MDKKLRSVFFHHPHRHNIAKIYPNISIVPGFIPGVCGGRECGWGVTLPIRGCTLYIDDNTVFYMQTDKTLLQRNLQWALNLLHIWCKENGMHLNTDKTKVMFITTRQKRATLSVDVLALKSYEFRVFMLFFFCFFFILELPI